MLFFGAVSVVKGKPVSPENDHFNLKINILTSISWTVLKEIIVV